MSNNNTLSNVGQYLKKHPVKGAAIITVTAVAVTGLAAAAVFSGGGAMAIAGAVAAGVIGTGGLAAVVRTSAREEKMTNQLRNMKHKVEKSNNIENSYTQSLKPDPTPQLSKKENRQINR